MLVVPHASVFSTVAALGCAVACCVCGARSGACAHKTIFVCECYIFSDCCLEFNKACYYSCCDPVARASGVRMHARSTLGVSHALRLFNYGRLMHRAHSHISHPIFQKVAFIFLLPCVPSAKLKGPHLPHKRHRAFVVLQGAQHLLMVFSFTELVCLATTRLTLGLGNTDLGIREGVFTMIIFSRVMRWWI